MNVFSVRVPSCFVCFFLSGYFFSSINMANQRNDFKEMEEAFNMITIEDEEQGGLVYEENTESLSEIDTR